MNLTDLTELVKVILGYSIEDDPDLNSLEEELENRFDVNMEQFEKIAELLVEFTIPTTTSLSGSKVQGFVKDGIFIFKNYLE